MYIIVVICVVVFFNFNNLVQCEEAKLLSVATVYRHGARGPIKLYKNDPYKNIAKFIWPDGFDQLANLGKTQQFKLGKWFREHYKDFIPEIYDPKFLRVLSSDLDKCLMSASSNLAGLFPPKGRQIWKQNLQWQPIPIHTSPIDDDSLLALMKPCPKFNKQLTVVLNSKPIQTFLEDRLSLFQYIDEHSGEKTLGDKFNIFHETIEFHDTLYVEETFQLELPHWTHKVYPNFTLTIFSVGSTLPTYTPDLARLRTGPLIDYITTFFEDVIIKPNSSQKFLMLSAQDTSIINILHSLGLYDGSWPEFSSVLTFELKSRQNQNFINIYFKNSTILQNLTLKNCLYDCRFDQFKNITKDLRISPENWQKECFDEEKLNGTGNRIMGYTHKIIFCIPLLLGNLIIY